MEQLLNNHKDNLNQYESKKNMHGKGVSHLEFTTTVVQIIGFKGKSKSK